MTATNLAGDADESGFNLSAVTVCLREPGSKGKCRTSSKASESLHQLIMLLNRVDPRWCVFELIRPGTSDDGAPPGQRDDLWVSLRPRDTCGGPVDLDPYMRAVDASEWFLQDYDYWPDNLTIWIYVVAPRRLRAGIDRLVPGRVIVEEVGAAE